jgi:hypothetical protein
LYGLPGKQLKSSEAPSPVKRDYRNVEIRSGDHTPQSMRVTYQGGIMPPLAH